MSDLDIAGLEAVDPRRVPLPHGTEVSTTADRPARDGRRIVPQGAVGRVVGVLEDGRVRVRIVGVGELVYPRSDLIPRRRGQLTFAVRRERDERALRPCAILEATVGSRAWGLSDDDSDTDVRGVFLWPFPWTTSLRKPADVITSLDGSTWHWELGRTVEQGLRADPNTLEMLFVDDVRTFDPAGEALLEARDAFVSQDIYGSFGRYALSQSRKLASSLRLAEHRAVVLEWLVADADLGLDAVAARLAREVMGGEEAARVLEAKRYLKQLYRSMFDQGLLEGNSFDALRAFARDGSQPLELPRELRPKNAYNLLRIVHCAVTWLRTGAPELRARGELRDRLLAIKRGEVPLRTALDWTQAVAEQLEDARASSVLPPKPDVDRVERLLRTAREAAARRWLDREPGPWGRDAPDPPGSELE